VQQGPAPKVVVETQSATVQQPAAAQGVMPAGGQAFGMGGMPTMMAGGMPMTGEVKERTRLGFAFDTIKIPIPVIRPIAIPQPAEVTFRTQLQPQSTGFGFAAAPMAMPMATMPVGMSMGTMGMVPQPAIGYGQVTVQGQLPGGQAALSQAAFAQGAGGSVQLTPQQLAVLQAMVAQQQGGGAGAAAAAQGAGGGDAAALQERLRATEAELKKLEAICAEVAKLRQQGGGEKKDGEKKDGK